MNNSYFRIGAVLCVLSLMGAGCTSWSSTNTSQESTGPKPATFEQLSPKDAAHKINLVSPNVIVLRQSFSDGGAELAKGLGWGSTATTTVVIKSFAPAQHATIEWKRETEVASGTKMLLQQFSGSLPGIDLLRSHSMLPPSYWVDGEHAALSSALWVSQDAYENFTKSKSGTFSFNVVEPQTTVSIKNAALQKAIADLKGKVDATINRKDVYLMTAEAPSEWTLKLNGVDTKVQVIKVNSWFGSFVFLDNPQNPLVLQLRTDPKIMGKLMSFFDFDVTELRDLTQ